MRRAGLSDGIVVGRSCTETLQRSVPAAWRGRLLTSKLHAVSRYLNLRRSASYSPGTYWKHRLWKR